MPTQSVTTAIYALDGSIGINFAATSASPTHALGTEKQASDGNTYIYVQADGAVTAADACLLKEGHEIDQLTTTLSGDVPTPVVFPQIAFADNEYGWAVLKGVSFNVNALADCAKDVKVYTTATPGCIDDAATDLIQGLRLNTLNGGSTAAVDASAPNGAYTNAQD